MSVNSSIEWTEATWNPVTGCDRVSPGCDHCYAATLAKRLKAMGNPRYQKDGTRRTSGPGFGLTLHWDKVDEPLKRSRPTTYFVNSMSDLFHPDVPTTFIEQIFNVMAVTPQHIYQVLTKRPRRMASETRRYYDRAKGMEEGSPLPNVWLGTSVESQDWAEKRVPLLLDAPAAVRFLSCEPLLDGVKLDSWIHRCSVASPGLGISDCCGGCRPQLHWVIVGGESGPGARGIDPEWVRYLRDQCVAASVPFFFKQWGGRTSKAGGRELDGRTWEELPVTPNPRPLSGSAVAT